VRAPLPKVDSYAVASDKLGLEPPTTACPGEALTTNVTVATKDPGPRYIYIYIYIYSFVSVCDKSRRRDGYIYIYIYIWCERQRE
jgi:hypothetical protein